MHLENNESSINSIQQLLTFEMDPDNNSSSYSNNMSPITPNQQSTNSYFLFTDSTLSSPGDNEWENVQNVIDIPTNNRPSSLTINGMISPGSSGSDINTPTSWIENTQDLDYSSDITRLPSVNTAFPFSRHFTNTNYYDGQTNYQEFDYNCYDDYQDCLGNDDVFLTFDQTNTLQNQNNYIDIKDINTVQAVDEFDLSFIRGDPTTLLNNTLPLSSSSLLDDKKNLTSEISEQCYPVGHLISNSSTTNHENNYQVKCEIENSVNKIVLPQKDGLMLTNNSHISSRLCNTESKLKINSQA